MSDAESAELAVGEQLDRGKAIATQEDLEAFLAEVNALAIRVKQRRWDLQIPKGLPAGAKLVLQILDRFGPKTVPQIARLRCTSRQNIQILVNRLQSNGCLELVQNPGHRRSCFARMTERGRISLAGILRNEDGLMKGLAPQLPRTELLSCVRMLRQVRTLLAEMTEVAHRQQLFQRSPVIERSSGTQFESETGPSGSASSRAQERARADAVEISGTGIDLPVSLL